MYWYVNQEQPLSTQPTILVDLDSALLEKVIAVLRWQALLSPKELASIKSATLSEGDIAECGALIEALFALNIPIALKVASNEKEETVRLIPFRVALQSEVLKLLLQGAQIREPIVLDTAHEAFCNVLFFLEKLDEIAEREKAMEKLCEENYEEWCNLIVGKPTSYILIDTYVNDCLEKDLSQDWSKRRERRLTILSGAVDLLLAANFLDIKPLLNPAAHALATQLREDVNDFGFWNVHYSLVKKGEGGIPDCIFALLDKDHKLYGQDNRSYDWVFRDGFVDVDGLLLSGSRLQDAMIELWNRKMQEIDSVGFACLKRIPGTYMVY